MKLLHTLLVSVLFGLFGSQIAKPLGINPYFFGVTLGYIGALMVKLDHFLTFWGMYLETREKEERRKFGE